jgi:hypothetical protein
VATQAKANIDLQTRHSVFTYGSIYISRNRQLPAICSVLYDSAHGRLAQNPKSWRVQDRLWYQRMPSWSTSTSTSPS